MFKFFFGIYNAFILLVVVMKIVFIISAIIVFYHKKIKKDTDSEKYKKAVENKQTILNISEFLMFVLLGIVFFPKNRQPVEVTHEEKLIFLVLAVLGIIGCIQNWVLSNKNSDNNSDKANEEAERFLSNSDSYQTNNST